MVHIVSSRSGLFLSAAPDFLEKREDFLECGLKKLCQHNFYQITKPPLIQNLLIRTSESRVSKISQHFFIAQMPLRALLRQVTPSMAVLGRGVLESADRHGSIRALDVGEGLGDGASHVGVVPGVVASQGAGDFFQGSVAPNGDGSLAVEEAVGLVFYLLTQSEACMRDVILKVMYPSGVSSPIYCVPVSSNQTIHLFLCGQKPR